MSRKYRTKRNAVVPYEKKIPIDTENLTEQGKRRNSLIFGVISFVLILSLVFVLFLHPMNESLPYYDQHVLSVEDYFSRLSQGSVYVEGNPRYTVNTSRMPDNGLLSDMYATIDIGVRKGANDYEILQYKSLNRLSDLNDLNDPNYKFYFAIEGQLLESYIDGQNDDGTFKHFVDLKGFYMNLNRPPDFAEFTYIISLYSEDAVDVKFYDVLGRMFALIGESIIYGVKNVVKLIPIGATKVRRDFGVTIPWRC